MSIMILTQTLFDFSVMA